MSQRKRRKFWLDSLSAPFVPGHVLQYMELVAGQRGEDAIYRWLYCKNNHDRWLPRYCRNRLTGEIVARRTDLDSAPAGHDEITNEEALSFVLDRLTKKGMIPCSS